MAQHRPRPPAWKDVPEYVMEFAAFVEQTTRLEGAISEDVHQRADAG